MKRMIIPVLALTLFTGCNFNKTEEGELPEVDVDVDAEAGDLPDYNVNWADVDVGTTTKMVEVPKVVVVMEEEEVEVPAIDVDMPDGGDKVERNLLVEAEVENEEHTMEIQQIWATGMNLNVISELKSTGKDIGDQKMRVSDQVSLNAPEDLNVRYFIVGEKQNRDFNSQHTYVNSMADLDEQIGEHDVIYTR